MFISALFLVLLGTPCVGASVLNEQDLRSAWAQDAMGEIPLSSARRVLQGEEFMVPLEQFSITVTGSHNPGESFVSKSKETLESLDEYLFDYMGTFMPNLAVVDVALVHSNGLIASGGNRTIKFHFGGNATFEGPPARTQEEVDAALSYALTDAQAATEALIEAPDDTAISALPSDPAPRPPPAHAVCETPLLMQPAGPGDEVNLLEDTRFDVKSLHYREPCSTRNDLFDYHLYYYFVGTGNAFYITTCDRQEDHEDLSIDKLTVTLEVAKGLNCTDRSTEPVCVAEHWGFRENCPDGEIGISYAFETEVGAEYTFSLSAKGDEFGQYNLRVGEIEIASDAATATCETAEEIETPVPDGEDSASITLVKNNSGLYSSGFQEVCPDAAGDYDIYSGGMWFSFEAPDVPSRLSFSTCTEETEVSATLLGLMVEEKARGESSGDCLPEDLVCIKHDTPGTWSAKCELNGVNSDFASLDVVSKPGERYYLYVSSEYPFDFGNIGVKITVEAGVSNDEFVEFELLLRENRRPGVECVAPWAVPAGLTCTDACVYCESNDGLLSGSCFNRTETVVFDQEYSGTMMGYKVDINTYRPDSQAASFEYRELPDSSCEAFLNGVSCSACEKQDCGAPSVDCTNVPGVIDRTWNTQTLDLCSLESNVFSFGIGDHNPDRTCDRFLSELACNSTATEIQKEGLGCECAVEAETGDSAMECHSECGLFCNEDISDCGVYEVSYDFKASGDRDWLTSKFQYTVGGYIDNNNDFSLSMGTSYCSATAGYTSCTDCQITECDGGPSPTSMFLPQGLAFTCEDSDGVFDGLFATCDNTVQIEDGPHQVFSGYECVDLAPSNSRCENAIPLKLTDGSVSVTGSTAYAGGESRRSVDCAASSTQDGRNIYVQSGLFYTISGTGGWLRASTCFNETDQNWLHPLLIEGACTGSNANCVLSPWGICGGNGGWINFETQEDQEYIIQVGGPDRGNFRLEIEEIEIIPSQERCEAALEERLALDAGGDYNCTCSQFLFFDIWNLDCLSSCLRCDSDSNPDYCVDNFVRVGYGRMGVYAKKELLNLTGSFDGAVGVTTFYDDSECEAKIAVRGENATDCSCSLITCADGSEAATIDCSEFEEGLQLNLCEDTEVSANNPLTTLIPTVYGQCYGEVATSVERSGGAEDEPKVTKEEAGNGVFETHEEAGDLASGISISMGFKPSHAWAVASVIVSEACGGLIGLVALAGCQRG